MIDREVEVEQSDQDSSARQGQRGWAPDVADALVDAVGYGVIGSGGCRLRAYRTGRGETEDARVIPNLMSPIRGSICRLIRTADKERIPVPPAFPAIPRPFTISRL